jgi:hypothetical protein
MDKPRKTFVLRLMHQCREFLYAIVPAWSYQKFRKREQLMQ